MPAVTATGTSPAPWPSMRGDVSNRGRARVAYRPLPDSVIRRWQAGGAVFSTPVIGRGEIVYVGGSDGELVAYDPLAGKELWRYRADGVIDSAACLGEDGTVYVPSGDGRIHALTPEGKRKWTFDLVADRKAFTPSTIYWFEGNVVPGPDGMLYAGNDDFRVYSITPEGELRWSTLTGLHIWGAAGFRDDVVYVSSFDMHVHALRRSDGSTLWKSFVGDFIASSPAVDEEGRVFVGSFDGSIVALDGAKGRILWRQPTGGPVYASAAITPDGALCIGSGDGTIRSLDRATGEARWTFCTGAGVRASVAIGPDPEHGDSFLLYVGDADGTLFALDPAGRVRWSYRAGRGEDVTFTGINASPALGAHGLCVSCADGDVVYLPYDAYLRFPEVFVAPVSRASGTRAVLLSAVGARTAEGALTLRPGEIVGVRLEKAEAEGTRRLRATGFRPDAGCTYPSRALTSPDRTVVHLLPDAIPAEGDYVLSGSVVSADSRGRETAVPVRREVHVRAAAEPPPLADLPALRIDRMSVSSPGIVVAFDQIGIASLRMDLRIVRHDPTTGAVLAWGIQRFGMDEGGHAVGVPIPRRLLFAFRGEYRNGTLSLESERCHFEITAFPVSIDRLRLIAQAGKDGWEGSTLLIESAYAGIRADFRRWFHRLLWPRPGTLIGLPGRLFDGAVDLFRQVRSWFPAHVTRRDFRDFRLLVRRAFFVLWAMWYRKPWFGWGLLDSDLLCRSAGAFRATPLSPEAPRGIALRKISFHRFRRQIIARFRFDPATCPRGVIPGILLYDADTLRPLAVPYTTHTHTQLDRKTGLPKRTILDLPADVHLRGRRIAAVVMLDLAECGGMLLPSGKLRPWTVWEELRWLMGYPTVG